MVKYMKVSNVQFYAISSILSHQFFTYLHSLYFSNYVVSKLVFEPRDPNPYSETLPSILYKYLQSCSYTCVLACQDVNFNFGLSGCNLGVDSLTTSLVNF